mmetsp:Transcript_18159/g.29836  ORF Transcript_18159/g.29836 Transcript_18159/m.29836 type:complete len:192 (-) Transcript_18159:228-803(-)
MDVPSSFLVSCTGQIESALFPEHDNLYCKFSFQIGQDWSVVQGVEDGITQITTKQDGTNRPIVWNFPLDITFKSSNAFGWPQLILSAYGLDALGRDVIRGYGVCRIPLGAGRYTEYVRMFTPMSSSRIQQFTAWLTGMKPEYVDPKFVSKGAGREITRTRSSGTVKVQFSIVTKDMNQFGYSDAKPQSGYR